jgi:hypothetical protein
MSLEDNYFGCSETPLWLPPAFNIQEIQKCTSCTLRLTAALAGPGLVNPHRSGLTIDENPTVSLSVNGIDHNLTGTILTFPGAHKFPDRQNPCDAELFLFFQNTRDSTKQICLTVPLDIGPGDANPYFKTLTNVVQNNRPTVDTVIPKDTKLLMYPGADIRGRSKDNPRPESQCEPVKRVITYYVCMTPANIASNDYSRLIALAAPWRNGPAKPRANVLITRLRSLATCIDKLILSEKQITSRGRGVDTKSMKCYRLDKDRDVIGSKVYVGDQAKPARTLDQELAEPSELENDGITDASVRPGDIEQVLAIVLGVTVGIVVCATVAYYIWKYCFTNYLQVQKLYNSPLSASSLSFKFPSLPRICPPAKI